MRNAQQSAHLQLVDGTNHREVLEAHLESALARVRQNPQRSLVVLAVRPESDEPFDLALVSRRFGELLRPRDWVRRWADNLLIVAEVGSTREAAALHHRLSVALAAGQLGAGTSSPTLDILAPNPWRPAIDILEWARRSAGMALKPTVEVPDDARDNPVSVTVHADDAAPRRLREYVRSTLAGRLRDRLVADISLAVTEMATQLLVDEAPATLHLGLWQTGHGIRAEVKAPRVVASDEILVSKPGSEWAIDIVRMLATQTGETLTRRSRTFWCEF